MNEFTRLIALLLLTGVACTVEDTSAPPFTGPSELALRVRLQAVPDAIVQDGVSQAVIAIEATGPDGRPVTTLPLRVDVIFEGSIQDFGSISSKIPVTDNDGRARITYTAPPRPNQPVDPVNVVTISVTPIGGDFRGEIPRTVDLRLIPPGVIVPPNDPPKALFTFAPSAPLVLDTVVFDASSSTDEGSPCGPNCTYEWAFGDGSAGTGVFASHQYRTIGTFQVRLTVTDDQAAFGAVALPVTVADGPAPTASFVFSPASPVVGQPIFFTAEASRAGAGRRIVSYDWNFGSGRIGTGMAISKGYDVAGTYVVTLTVTDNAGRQSTVSQSVVVRASTPGSL